MMMVQVSSILVDKTSLVLTSLQKTRVTDGRHRGQKAGLLLRLLRQTWNNALDATTSDEIQNLLHCCWYTGMIVMKMLRKLYITPEDQAWAVEQEDRLHQFLKGIMESYGVVLDGAANEAVIVDTKAGAFSASGEPAVYSGITTVADNATDRLRAAELQREEDRILAEKLSRPAPKQRRLQMEVTISTGALLQLPE